MTRRPAALLLLPLVLLGPLALAGCAGEPADRAALSAASPDPAVLVDPGEMEDPTPGVVELDGGDPFAGHGTGGFGATPAGRGVTVETTSSGADRGFVRLCRGEVDLVSATRAASAAEVAGCRANGLDVVTFTMATSATVAAVAVDADDVPDCLTAAEVAAATAGVDDAATLDRVAGSAADRDRAADLPRLRTEWDDAVVLFKAQRSWFFTARDELRFARAERERGIADDRPPRLRAKDDARLRGAESQLARARAARRAAKAELGRIEPLLAAAERSARLVTRARGTVGRFDAGFVATADGLLRPLALATDEGCVLPTPEAVASGAYPLTHPVVLSGTDRSLARGEVAAFVRHLLDEAPTLTDRAGLAPVPEEVLATQRGWLDGDLPVDGGSPPERPAQ